MLSGNMLKVLQLIDEGKNEIGELRKRTRLPEKMLERILDEMTKNDYIKVEEERYSLTEKGNDILKKSRI